MPLERGENRVHFRFAMPGLAPVHLVLAVNALAWLGGLAIVFVVGISRSAPASKS